MRIGEKIHDTIMFLQWNEISCNRVLRILAYNAIRSEIEVIKAEYCVPITRIARVHDHGRVSSLNVTLDNAGERIDPTSIKAFLAGLANLLFGID